MNFHYKRAAFRILSLLSALVMATSIISLISTDGLTADGSITSAKTGIKKVQSQDDDEPKSTVSKLKRGSINKVQSQDDDEPKVKIIDIDEIGDRVKVEGKILGVAYEDDFLNSDREVTLKIFTPSGRLYDSIKVRAQSDGEFVGYLDMSDRPGRHNIIATFRYYDTIDEPPAITKEKKQPLNKSPHKSVQTTRIERTQQEPLKANNIAQNLPQSPLIPVPSMKVEEPQPKEQPKVNIHTDKETYKIGDRVKVVGEITGIQSNNDFLNSDREVTLKIFTPSGRLYDSIKVRAQSDGEFVGYLDMDDTSGYHRITATSKADGTFYDDETSFSVTAGPEKPIPIPMELMTILAIGGPAGFASYKMLKPKPKADILRLGIECGIEEANHKKINEFGSLHFTCDARKIEEKFTSIWSIIQESREKARQLQNVKEFSDWCKEAKEDPNLVVSKISDEIIGKLLVCARPFFTNLLLDDICLKSQYNVLNKNNKLQQPEAMNNNYVQHELQFLMKPIHPYIEIALLVNEIKKSAVKLVFKIETCVYINKIELSSTPTNIRINTQGLNASITFSISKLCISHFSKPIDLEIPLGNKEFLINELNLTKCMEVRNKNSIGVYSYR